MTEVEATVTELEATEPTEAAEEAPIVTVYITQLGATAQSVKGPEGLTVEDALGLAKLSSKTSNAMINGVVAGPQQVLEDGTQLIVMLNVRGGAR